MLTTALLVAQISVLSQPGDSFRSLAEEIASKEHGQIVSTVDRIHGDGYVVWVASPQSLSDKVIIEFVTAWRDRFPDAAVGLITGSDLPHAHALWERSAQVRDGRSAAFHALTRNIDETAFLTALSTHSYITFSGHGGPSYLRLGGPARVTPEAVPTLRNLVIGTESCNVLRPWDQRSIALAFADNGAAAFAGFVYSPLSSDNIYGASAGLPFRYSHPEFPIGRVVQLQSLGTLRGFAVVPYLLLIGDPRIALHKEMPWSVGSDRVNAGVREIQIRNAPAGMLPIRIPDGALYEFVRTSRFADSARYPFYMPSIEMRNIGADKFVLVEHEGGPLTLRLFRDTPAGWMAGRYLAQALDTILLRVIGTGEGLCMTLIGIGGLGVAMRRQRRFPLLARASLAGGAVCLLHVLWAVLRGGMANPFAFAATMSLTTYGTFLFLTSTSRMQRVRALAIAVLYALLPVMFYAGSTWVTNTVVFRPRVGASIYGYQLARLALGALAVSCATVCLLWKGLTVARDSQRRTAG